jgi:hypothetical protein
MWCASCFSPRRQLLDVAPMRSPCLMVRSSDDAIAAAGTLDAEGIRQEGRR